MMLDRLRNLSTERQLAFVLFMAGIIAVVLCIVWMVLRVPFQPLFTNLRTVDAAAVVAELDRKKIPYRLTDGGATILVPASDVDVTRLNLVTGDLPLKGTVGFELFNKSDMGLTDFAQKINYQRALQGELERTIMALDGVEECRVHLSLGEDRIFREDRVSPKASVMIRMRAGGIVPPEDAAGVQRLVAAAVPQLEAADVVIIDETGRAISTDRGAAAEQAEPGDPEEQAIGAYYAARIEQVIRKAYPGDEVRVQVSTASNGPDGAMNAGDWNPAARDFPLQVTLDLDPALDGLARQDVRALAARTIAYDVSLGDSIRFGTIKPVADVPATTEPSLVHRPVKTEPPMRQSSTLASATTVSRVALPLIAVALLIMAVWLWVKAGSRHALSAEQRSRLAARLKQLLDLEEATDVVRS